MINPNIKSLKEGAGQDFLSSLTTFSVTVAAPRPTSGLRCTRLGAPRQGHVPAPAPQQDCTSQPMQGRAPGNRTRRKPRGEMAQGNRLLQAASPTAMQSGWFFQVPPYLVLPPVPGPGRDLEIPGPGGARPSMRVSEELWEPLSTAHPAVQEGEARCDGT